MIGSEVKKDLMKKKLGGGGKRTHSGNKRAIKAVGGHIESSFLPKLRFVYITIQWFPILRTPSNKLTAIAAFYFSSLMLNFAIKLKVFLNFPKNCIEPP